eukprot:CAMPEP_0196738992 /NCGR_PEP_ID=MMETSP1091-20130531/18493_1 /TAXON_ID=302021 /ORGANISM="Rhodomonas sp., Strain CCMP768" /LENGTH=46 /DNA_ID= /DNA_START= /DNA_END= /DNA_ORIENTATION=
MSIQLHNDYLHCTSASSLELQSFQNLMFRRTSIAPVRCAAYSLTPV